VTATAPVDTHIIDVFDHCPAFADTVADGPLTRSPIGRALLHPIAGVTALSCRDFASRVLDIGPRAVVCTHPLATLLAARAANASGSRLPVIDIATDLAARGLTPRKGVALHCVANERTREALIRRGVESRRIEVTGIPVRAQFTVEYDLHAAREHFGLPTEGRVVLAVVGSSDPLPYAPFKESLSVLLPALAALPETSVAIVTGEDAAYAAELTSRIKGFGTTNVHILERVEHMAPLIAASDLVLARPRGVMCAEVMAAGVPLLLVGPAAGVEHENARGLVESGAALFAEDPRTIAERARTALSSTRRLTRMREAAVAGARPFASAEIARHTLALAGLAFGEDDA
jgi:processive 1,2-diacylglycerol beta-glucosyltransferase